MKDTVCLFALKDNIKIIITNANPAQYQTVLVVMIQYIALYNFFSINFLKIFIKECEAGKHISTDN